MIGLNIIKGIWADRRLPLICVILALTCASSCEPDKDEVLRSEATVNVVFRLRLDDVGVRSDDAGVVDCYSPTEIDPEKCIALIYIREFGDGPVVCHRKGISREDGMIVPEPVELVRPDGDKGNHVLTRLILVDREDEQKVYWSTVDESSGKYAGLVPAEHLTPYEISCDGDEDGGSLLPAGTVGHGLTLLCAMNDTPDDFGYAMWDLEFMRVMCYKYSVNVCGDPCDLSVRRGHEVGSTRVAIFKKHGDKCVSVFEDYSEPGRLGELCFSDSPEVDDECETFIISLTVEGYGTISAELTGDMLFDDYKDSGFWDVPFGSESGYIHFDLCDLRWELDEEVPPSVKGFEGEAWPFRVSVPKICDYKCDSDCGDIFELWREGKMFDCDSDCSWEVRCGCFCVTEIDHKTAIYTNTDMPKVLLTNGQNFERDATVVVIYEAISVDAVCVDMLPHGVAERSVTEVGDSDICSDAKIYRVELKVKSAGCHALRIDVDPALCSHLFPMVYITDMFEL